MKKTFTEWFLLYSRRSSWLKKRQKSCREFFEDVHPEILYAVDLCYYLIWSLANIILDFFLWSVILKMPFITNTEALKIALSVIYVLISLGISRVIGVAVAALMLKMRYRKQ